MADPTRIIAIFEDIQLHSFPEEWVQKCWSEDFVDLGSLPVESGQFLSETKFLTTELDILGQLISFCLDLDNENEEGFWNILVDNNIPHKVLVVLLAHLTHNAGKVSITCQERIAGVHAASVYLKLVALPGSAAFKIFHPELFLQACRLLNKWNKTDLGGNRKNKRRRSSSQFSPNSQRSKGKRGKKRRSDDSFADDEEDEEEHMELSDEDSQRLDICMRQLLEDVLLMCEKFSLRQSVSTASQLMSVLISITRMSPECITETMGCWNSVNCSIGMMAYKGVFLLCQPIHGHVTSMTNQACKLLLNHILMTEDGKMFSNLSRPITMMRKHGIEFVKYLMQHLGERCVRSVKTLLQHISFKVPDKADYRSHTAQAIYELLQILPDSEYASFLEWTKGLSKHKKVAQRSFTIDVMSVLMDKPERILTNVSPETADFATHKSMLCTLLSRCSDSNASICARALVAFSSNCNSNMTNVVSTLKGLITPIAGGQGRPTAKHFVPTPQVRIHKDDEKDGSEDKATEQDKDVEKENVENVEKVASADAESSGAAHGTVVDGGDGGTPCRMSENSFANIALTPGFNPYLPDNEGVVSMFRRRVLDTKVVVRKSALQALQQVLKFEWPDYCEEDLVVLQERCADPALSVRKQCIQCVLELLEAFPQDKKIQRAWIYGLLPRVMDIETTVQEKCFDSLEEMIILKIQPHGRLSESGIEWELLSVIVDESSDNLRRYLQKACQHWCRMKKLRPSLVLAIESHIGGPNDKSAWMLLAELSKTTANINPKTAVSHWYNCNPSTDDSSFFKWSNVLYIIAAGIKSLSEDTVNELKVDLRKRLLKFSYPFEIIQGIVNTLCKLHSCEIGTKSRISQLKKAQAWGVDVMTACDKYMSEVILNAQKSQGRISDEDRFVRYIFTLGEVCQRCPLHMSKRLCLLIQSIIAEPCISEFSTQSTGSQSQNNSGESNTQETNSESQQATGNKDLTEPLQASQEDDEESSQSSQASQATQSQTGPTQSSQPLSQFRGFTTSHKLRAHAFISLGKLCLIDEDLAKKSIAALARELEVSESPAVRNNVVIVMRDLTVRYTTLVDRYITNIAACLKDPDALVRKNTLTVLTKLLQEEYVKWKGVLFFRYITTLLDEIEEIKHLSEFCLEHLFLKKYPTLFFNPFIECIFYFNNYTTHSVYNKFKQTQREKTMFTLAGRRKARQRMRLYTYMLEHMSDEQRFKITAKLNKDILSAIVEGTIPLDVEGGLVLKDALAILSCKEIKLSTMRTKPAEEAGEEEEPNVAQIMTATAKKVLITQVVRRNVIENIVPVVIALKHMLEKEHSTILKNLMVYLRELMADYKTEVKDILSADKQLAEEIEFDLKNFEKQRVERMALVSRRASAASTPTTTQPSTPVAANLSGRRVSQQISASPLASCSHGDSTPTAVPDSPSLNKEGRVLAEASTKLNKVAAAENDGKQTPTSDRRLSLNVSKVLRVVMTRVDELRQQEAKKKAPPPQIPGHTRAISTPTRDIENITFQEDVDVSMLPPSPIPLMARNKGTRGSRQSQTHQLSQSSAGAQSSSGDSGVTKWNIQSPVALRATRSSEKSKDDSASKKVSVAEQTTPTRQSRRSRRKLTD